MSGIKGLTRRLGDVTAVDGLTLTVAEATTAAFLAGRAPDGGQYVAEIRRTEYGIPRILADDYGSLGYGYGYAFAQDNLCVMADRVITLRGERSRYFGPTADSGDTLGAATINLDSDVYYRASRNQAFCHGCWRVRYRWARRRRHASWSTGTWPATTATCTTPARCACRIRPAGAWPGSHRSPRRMCGASSTTSTGWPGPPNSSRPSPRRGRQPQRLRPPRRHRPGTPPTWLVTAGRWAATQQLIMTGWCWPTRTSPGPATPAFIRCN
jgi:Penicillin amidase